MSCYRKRSSPKCNKCCHREVKPYPPDPEPPVWCGPVIPIVSLADVPSATAVPNGAIILVGEQQSNVMDPNDMPDPSQFSIAVANGCFWNMMAPGALGCDPMPPMTPTIDMPHLI
jgi:hypothetical protein